MAIPFCALQIMYDVCSMRGRKTWTPQQLKVEQLTHFPAHMQRKQQHSMALVQNWGEKTKPKWMGIFVSDLEVPLLFAEVVEMLKKHHTCRLLTPYHKTHFLITFCSCSTTSKQQAANSKPITGQCGWIFYSQTQACFGHNCCNFWVLLRSRRIQKLNLAKALVFIQSGQYICNM